MLGTTTLHRTMPANASYVPHGTPAVQAQVLNAITQGHQQRQAPIDAFDVAQMEDVAIGEAQQACCALERSGQIQRVQGTDGYAPVQRQMG